ncbi:MULTISPECIES: TolC family protein [Olivibacter]|jgi:outer membrane protein TolC|uniref:TolC family protein n=2 Tax=Olivibacter TaxID=376469 RepID=A0ABV6HQJ6_9SPHI|nr:MULTISPECIES: TolC family protein [Olivibacter]MDX3917432.1 TolC family protein [Pseudosphingobacterium sp.]QEL03936.1 TolC family protein [Olivibacter sp. LS-1]
MKKTAYIIITTFLLLGGHSPLQAQKKLLSLADALGMASEGNKALQVQVLEEIHAAALTREKRGTLLPSISANVAYSHFFDRQTIFLPGSFAGTSKPVQEIAVGGRNAYNGFISLYQPIFAPSIKRQTKAALINEKMQHGKTADFNSRIALRVSTNYLGILMMMGQLDLLEQSLQRNIKALKDAQSLFLQGRALKSDTLRSFIAVENLKSSVSYLKNSINVSTIELKRLIGLEETNDIQLSDKLDVDLQRSQYEFYTVDEALKTAEANRKDLGVQKLAIDFQQKKMKVAQAELMPTLSLIGQYQVQAQSDDMRFGDYAWPRTSFLGVQLSVPIFNGNRTRSQISQANIRLQQEQIRLNDFKDEIKTQLATIISKWKEAKSQLEIQKTTVNSAELNYQMNENRFENGLSSRLELTDAELALTQARINHLRATYNLRVLHTELQHTLGLLSL